MSATGALVAVKAVPVVAIVPALAVDVARRWDDPQRPLEHGFLIRRHGLYTWGADLDEVIAVYRRMMDKRPENRYQSMTEVIAAIDAVVVGTPDHARVLPCIHACQAGLDVYAEKPLTLTISEGRRLVEHARKNKTVFQVGSQQRTMEMNRFACELVRTGGIGKIRRVQGICYTGPRDYQGLPGQPIPEGNRVGIITNTGGPAVIATDILVGAGLTIPPLSVPFPVAETKVTSAGR